MPSPPPRFDRKTLDDLELDDEASFRHIGLYADLKEVLRRDRYSFRILPPSLSNWDNALFLNLTFWGANEGGDVLVDATLPADVVTHVAWHRLATRAFGAKEASPGARPSVDALFLGEAIASAFDIYLVARMLGHAPDSSFLATRVPAMAEAADAAGVDEAAFDAMLEEASKDPEGAFARLRELLTDATAALFACESAESALAVLGEMTARPYGSLLHHYELANWVLYARAYGDPTPQADVREADRAMRAAKDPLQWLTEAWVLPALA